MSTEDRLWFARLFIVVALVCLVVAASAVFGWDLMVFRLISWFGGLVGLWLGTLGVLILRDVDRRERETQS